MTLEATLGIDGAGGGASPHHQLDSLQWGHLRHMVRLSRQIPGDWSDMGPFDPTNEGDDAYRYQLAYMAYTLGLTQYHYLPAYRELLRETLANLIRKMLRHDVWGYWELTSRGSKVMDPDLEVLEDGWVDPVIRKNVMYSGHLLMMVSLYEMLYRDGRYFEPGSLTFECRPPFRGLGPQDFPYDLPSLAGVITEQFAASGGMGCECEPNGIFVYCNQFPMLGLSHLDRVRGTDVAPALMQGFRDAWSRQSSLFSVDTSTGLPVFLMVKQQEVVYEDSEDNKEAASVVSWGPFMHVWQREYVEALYPQVLPRVRRDTPWGFGVSLEQFHRTHLEYQARPSTELVDPMMLGVHTHGMLALLAAELGDEETRDGLLAHADAVMSPTWKDGGLFYPRCDELDTERYVTCVMGNGLLAAARINPPNGIHDLYTSPWTDDDVHGPQIVGVAFPDVLVTAARFDRDSRRLHVRLVPGDSPPAVAEFRVTGLDAARRVAMLVNGAVHDEFEWVAESDVLNVHVPMGDTCHIEIVNL
jgi:hypothetical protein